MNPETPVLLVKVTADGPLYSPEAISLLTGIAAEAVRAERVTTIDELPVEWLKAGRRRAAEARAVTGTADGLTGLRYWAAQEFNVELQMRDDGLYMPAPEVMPDA